MTVTLTVDLNRLDCRTATAILAFATTHGGGPIESRSAGITVHLNPATFVDGTVAARVDDHDPIRVLPEPADVPRRPSKRKRIDVDAARARAAEAI